MIVRPKNCSVSTEVSQVALCFEQVIPGVLNDQSLWLRDDQQKGQWLYPKASLLECQQIVHKDHPQHLILHNFPLLLWHQKKPNPVATVSGQVHEL